MCYINKLALPIYVHYYILIYIITIFKSATLILYPIYYDNLYEVTLEDKKCTAQQQ